VAELASWLAPGDALAINETRVRPARLQLRRPSGGVVECLFVRPEATGEWRVLARPARNARAGQRLSSDARDLTIEVVSESEGGERRVRIVDGDLDAALRAHGEMPLPPYIHRAPRPEDRERYQTVYARVEGAVAAPTAGLHFTASLLARLSEAGIESVPLLLHVGPGTFRPISAEDPGQHVMDEEWFEVSESSAARLRAAAERGGRIVAVGTTAVRALETCCDLSGGALEARSGWTRKYILPPYHFQAVTALLTNFHLPRTTLLLLVAAFAGEERLRRAYRHAVEQRYRFYSYGDAMLVR
jgi:S-adenosylmethionine:tRNA ribosyltransferase-isomerase